MVARAARGDGEDTLVRQRDAGGTPRVAGETRRGGGGGGGGVRAGGAGGGGERCERVERELGEARCGSERLREAKEWWAARHAEQAELALGRGGEIERL